MRETPETMILLAILANDAASVASPNMVKRIREAIDKGQFDLARNLSKAALRAASQKGQQS